METLSLQHGTKLKLVKCTCISPLSQGTENLQNRDPCRKKLTSWKDIGQLAMEEHISAKEELPTTTMATVGSGLPMHAGEAGKDIGNHQPGK